MQVNCQPLPECRIIAHWEELNERTHFSHPFDVGERRITRNSQLNDRLVCVDWEASQIRLLPGVELLMGMARAFRYSIQARV